MADKQTERQTDIGIVAPILTRFQCIVVGVNDDYASNTIELTLTFDALEVECSFKQAVSNFKQNKP